MSYSRVVFRLHAVQRMAQRGISVAEVRQVLVFGKVLEDYPTDTPYPSRLVLGWISGRPIQVVSADNDAAQETIVITAYIPDPTQWTTDFRRRLP